MTKKRIGAFVMALSLTVSTFYACDGLFHKHVFSEELKTDAISHWFECECGAKSQVEEHLPGGMVQKDGTHHWYSCSVCGEAVGVVEHTYGDDWKHNSSVHWHVCECGEKAEITKHSGGNATCNSKATCEVCDREYGTVSGHAFSELKELESGALGYACDCGESVNLLSTENEDGDREGGLVDFVVEVEAGREPVILQLSDTQFMDSKMEANCFKYVRETVAATNPDLILITGDLVYGRFDKTGTLFQNFIAFMEGLQIPWAPVFGNHDNECWLGVDWQCEQLEAAEYCLFEQGQVTGNGNYTVGILQENKLLRTFYMMDSNGCSNPAIAGDGSTYTTNPNKDNLGKVKTSAGFADDQVGWMRNSMEDLKEISPDTKISVACHIQLAYFLKAYEQYGYQPYLKEGSSSELKFALDLDGAKMIDTETGLVEKELQVKEGDIGYLGRSMKGAWDSSYSIFSNMKQLGVDSIFVGHEHCNSISVVYNGVRFQYSQKSSTYDRFNSIDSKGNIVGSYSNAGTELIGGTAFSLSQEDGAIINPYIYLYGDPLGMNPKK